MTIATKVDSIVSSDAFSSDVAVTLLADVISSGILLCSDEEEDEEEEELGGGVVCLSADTDRVMSDEEEGFSSSDTIVGAWRATVAVDSRVVYGSALDSLLLSAWDALPSSVIDAIRSSDTTSSVTGMMTAVDRLVFPSNTATSLEDGSSDTSLDSAVGSVEESVAASTVPVSIKLTSEVAIAASVSLEADSAEDELSWSLTASASSELAPPTTTPPDKSDALES